MKSIQIVKEESNDVIASFSEENGQIIGICENGYVVIVDGTKLK